MMGLHKSLWCVRCGQPAFINGRGERVHENYMTTANDHAVEVERPTMPGVVAGMRVLAGIEVNRMYEDRPEWVVLCDRETGHDRYIVWRIWYDRTTGELIRSSGNYISDFRRAVNVFGERGGVLAEVNDRVRTLEGMVGKRDEKIDELTDEISDLRDMEDAHVAAGHFIME